MPDFRIRILIDGKQAQAQAKVLQASIAKALSSAAAVDVDLSGLEKMSKAGGVKNLQLTGTVQLKGLTEADEQV